ncbi:MAG TPA: ATP synthase subunit I [Candidatus Acidoferrum sp.]|nr:ATP synthase subunit I [Candidatus Acidoferrum sp.]
MRNDQIPTIAAIQRMNVILVAVTAVILFFFDSSAAAIGCLLGGAIVIANLWVLSILGAMILAAAGAGISGTAAKFGVMAIPLKMLIVVGLVFLVFKRAHVDGVGFAFGVLTQMTAAIIETGRASLRGAS